MIVVAAVSLASEAELAPGSSQAGEGAAAGVDGGEIVQVGVGGGLGGWLTSWDVVGLCCGEGLVAVSRDVVCGSSAGKLAQVWTTQVLPQVQLVFVVVVVVAVVVN